MQVQVALNKSRTLYFATDLRFAVDNYRLANAGIRLGYEKGRLLPVALDEPADKSKFVTSSLGIPLRLIYKPFKHFQASVIAYSDFGIEATSLHKKPRVEYEPVGTANLSVRCRRNGFLLRHRHLRQLRRDPAVQEACGTGVPYVQFRHLAAHVTKYERT